MKYYHFSSNPSTDVKSENSSMKFAHLSVEKRDDTKLNEQIGKDLRNKIVQLL